MTINVRLMVGVFSICQIDDDYVRLMGGYFKQCQIDYSSFFAAGRRYGDVTGAICIFMEL